MGLFRRPHGIDFHVAGYSCDSLRPAGIGGIFVVSKDPKALAAWYRDVLGISLEPWAARHSATTRPGIRPSRFETPSRKMSYLALSRRHFMLDFAVDDLDAFLTRLKAKGVALLLFRYRAISTVLSDARGATQ